MQDTIQPATPTRKNRLLIVLIVAAVVVLALCAALFALIFNQVGQIASNEVPAMQKTVDDFHPRRRQAGRGRGLCPRLRRRLSNNSPKKT